jgi:hypothetical protein
MGEDHPLSTSSPRVPFERAAALQDEDPDNGDGPRLSRRPGASDRHVDSTGRPSERAQTPDSKASDLSCLQDARAG